MTPWRILGNSQLCKDEAFHEKQKLDLWRRLLSLSFESMMIKQQDFNIHVHLNHPEEPLFLARIKGFFLPIKMIFSPRLWFKTSFQAGRFFRPDLNSNVFSCLIIVFFPSGTLYGFFRMTGRMWTLYKNSKNIQRSKTG